MNRLFFLMLALFTSSLVFAGNEGPSGGDGVFIDDSLYLFDLVEVGVESSPYVENQRIEETYFSKVLGKVKNVLPQVNEKKVYEILAIKLIELADSQSLLANAILLTMSMHNWVFLSPEFIDVKDEDSTLDVVKLKMVQLATRQLNTIRIKEEYWMQLDDVNKAALILHEALFSLISPNRFKAEDGRYYVSQSSARVRQLNGLWFSENISRSRMLGYMVRRPVGVSIVGPSFWPYSEQSTPSYIIDDYVNSPTVYYGPFFKAENYRTGHMVKSLVSKMGEYCKQIVQMNELKIYNNSITLRFVNAVGVGNANFTYVGWVNINESTYIQNSRPASFADCIKISNNVATDAQSVVTENSIFAGR